MKSFRVARRESLKKRGKSVAAHARLRQALNNLKSIPNVGDKILTRRHSFLLDTELRFLLTVSDYPSPPRRGGVLQETSISSYELSSIG
jgi:hypothetical protein